MEKKNLAYVFFLIINIAKAENWEAYTGTAWYFGRNFSKNWLERKYKTGKVSTVKDLGRVEFLCLKFIFVKWIPT